jgi:hypothetical protein
MPQKNSMNAQAVHLLKTKPKIQQKVCFLTILSWIKKYCKEKQPAKKIQIWIIFSDIPSNRPGILLPFS